MKRVLILLVKYVTIASCIAAKASTQTEWVQASYRQIGSGVLVEMPVYMTIRTVSASSDSTSQLIYQGFRICPRTHFSSSGITLECVSMMSTVADLYVNNTFVTRDFTRPFTITDETTDGSFSPWIVPDGPVTLTCFTERYWTTLEGTFSCASSFSSGVSDFSTDVDSNNTTQDETISTISTSSQNPSSSSSPGFIFETLAPSSPPSTRNSPRNRQANVSEEITSVTLRASTTPSSTPELSSFTSSEPSQTLSTTPEPSISSSFSPIITSSESPKPSSSLSFSPSNSHSTIPEVLESITSTPTNKPSETPQASSWTISDPSSTTTNTPQVSLSSIPSESPSPSPSPSQSSLFSNSASIDPSAEPSPIESEPSTKPSDNLSDMIENSGSLNLTNEIQNSVQESSVETGGNSLIDSGSFRMVFPASHVLPTRRIDACVAVAKGKVYMIGGQYGIHPVAEFDPVTSSWKNKEMAPHEFHHHQCVTLESRIYIIGSWNGTYPRETSHENTWVYNVDDDSWSSIAGLPEWRRRGAGAAAIKDKRIYFTAGSSGGHGVNTELRPYLDVLDLDNIDIGWIAKDDIPDGRDHTEGGIAGGYFCVAGGRIGSESEYHEFQVAPINCFNIETEEWERGKDIPVTRSDPAVTGTCQGLILIAGGEDKDSALNRVDLYDPVKDEFLESISLVRSRLGAAAAVSDDCSCGNVYVMAGGAWKGSRALLNDIEIWSPDGVRRNC